MMSRSVFGVACERSADQILKRILAKTSHLKVNKLVCTPDTSIPADKVLFDGPKELGVMGFGLNLIKSLPRAVHLLNRTSAEVERQKPDVLITVDSGAFNLRLQRHVRNPGIKRVHVCAPSVWAFKDGPERAKRLLKLDGLFHLLPFESIYWKNTVNEDSLRFVGYFGLEPLLDATCVPMLSTDSPLFTSVPAPNVLMTSSHTSFPFPHEIELCQPAKRLPKISTGERLRCKTRIWQSYFASESFNSDYAKYHFLLLAPGSRPDVVRTSLPVMYDTIRSLSGDLKRNLAIVVLGSLGEDIQQLNASFVNQVKEYLPCALVPETSKLDAFGASDASIASSGTIITELLSFRVPTVVIYRAGGFLTRLYVERKAHVQFATLVNIIAGRKIVPEYLFEHCNRTDAIAQDIESFLACGEQSETMMNEVDRYLSSMIVWNGEVPVRPSCIAANYLNQHMV